jgi:D-alanyl-D-alanine carboxypeptidase
MNVRAARTFGAALLAASVAGCGGSSHSTVGPVCSDGSAKRPAVTRELRTLVKDYGLPGAVAAVCTRSGTVHAAVGFSDLRERTTMRSTDRFWVGSVTKTFVATVVLQLVAEGKLRLTDTVEHWLPGVVPRGREITIRELLNHTSGITDFLADERVQAQLERHPRAVLPPRTLIARAASHPLEFRPGHDWSYSNTNYLLLGLIVEKATGNSLREELTTRIFEPLHLAHTTFDSPRRRLLPSEMHGYLIAPGGERTRDVSLLTLGGVWAAGDIVSNVDDVAKFYSALLGGKLLRPDELRAMQTITFIAANDGLGLFHDETGCGRAWGHGGGTPGYLTIVKASGDGARVVVAATNGTSNPTGNALNDAANAEFCAH